MVKICKTTLHPSANILSLMLPDPPIFDYDNTIDACRMHSRSIRPLTTTPDNVPSVLDAPCEACSICQHMLILSTPHVGNAIWRIYVY